MASFFSELAWRRLAIGGRVETWPPMLMWGLMWGLGFPIFSGQPPMIKVLFQGSSWRINRSHSKVARFQQNGLLLFPPLTTIYLFEYSHRYPSKYDIIVDAMTVSDVTTLQQRINALRILGIHGDFIPQSSLYALMSRTVIADELRRDNYPPEDLSEAADLLVTGGRKVFAILVEIDAVKSTAEFLSAGLLDGKLHLRKEDLDHFNDPGLTVKFLKFQWDYIAPI